MIKQELSIINKLGLHARASSKLVQLANQFKAKISLSRANTKANAKSIMSVMMLAANKGSTLILEIDGEDEQLALQQILELVNNKFGEGE